MKPVELVERAVRNSSRRRDVVLDPFGGAGSTLLACEKTARQARLKKSSRNMLMSAYNDGRTSPAGKRSWPMTAGPSLKSRERATRAPSG